MHSGINDELYDEILERFGGLSGIYNIFRTKNITDVYNLETCKWYTLEYSLKFAGSACYVSVRDLLEKAKSRQHFILIGGVGHGNVYRGSVFGEVRIQHPLPCPDVKNYDQYKEYGTQLAQQQVMKFDTYKIASFVIKGEKKHFLVCTDLLNNNSNVMQLIEDNWKYGVGMIL